MEKRPVGRPKGTPRTGGRQKGTPNKITATVKQAIEAAFEKVGGAEYLAMQARENPVAFMTLLGKVLPTQIDANIITIGMPTITIPMPPAVEGEFTEVPAIADKTASRAA